MHNTTQAENNKGAVQTAQTCRLISAFFVCIYRLKAGFLVTRPSLNECLALLPTQGITWWVGQSGFFFFFLNIYYSHMDRYGSHIWKKKKLSSSKTGESVGNAKQTILTLKSNESSRVDFQQFSRKYTVTIKWYNSEQPRPVGICPV